MSNAFSSGIFLGIAIFHLLPEATEGFKEYFKENNITGVVTKLPLAYILTFFAFTLILFVEKIAFDSHALIEHDHGDSPEIENKDKKSESSSESEEDDEQIMKNLVSSTGKVGSFIVENSLCKQ